MAIVSGIDREKTADYDVKDSEFIEKGGWATYLEKMKDQAFASDFVSDIMLPGHITNGKKSCGKWKLQGCKEIDFHSDTYGYARKTKMSCYYKGCNICFEDEIRRSAQSVTDRLMTFTHLKNNKDIYLRGNRSRILHHITVSIPEEDYSFFLTTKGRSQVREKARKAIAAGYDVESDKIIYSGLDKLHSKNKNQIDGGAQFDHPYRFEEGLTKAIFSPHFHFIVTGWVSGPVCSKIEEKTGYLVKHIRTIETKYDCYNIVKYILSHAAVYLKPEDKRSPEHSIRYFAEAQNRKFKVETVLKHSVDGNTDIDRLISSMAQLIKNKQKSNELILDVSNVSYTHSIIKHKIKEGTNELFNHTFDNSSFELKYESLEQLKVKLRNYIMPKATIQLIDNPAIPQSDPLEEKEEPDMEFLQMRFNYARDNDIVQSVYLTIILDPDTECICPECTAKMRLLVPKVREKSTVHYEKIKGMLETMPEGEIMRFDDVELFDYFYDVMFSYPGMPYYDTDHNVQFDDGIYEKPSCIDDLQLSQYSRIMRNIEIQKVSHRYKLMLRDEADPQIRKTLKQSKKEEIEKINSDELLMTKPLISSGLQK